MSVPAAMSTSSLHRLCLSCDSRASTFECCVSIGAVVALSRYVTLCVPRTERTSRGNATCFATTSPSVRLGNGGDSVLVVIDTSSELTTTSARVATTRVLSANATAEKASLREADDEDDARGRRARRSTTTGSLSYANASIARVVGIPCVRPQRCDVGNSLILSWLFTSMGGCRYGKKM